MLKPIVFIFFGFSLACESMAHGDIYHRIDQLTQQIKKSPSDAQLLISRGRLYLDDQHSLEAETDFFKAIALAPKESASYFYLAQANLATGKTKSALQAVNYFLSKQKQSAPQSRGLSLRGEILKASGNFTSAAKDFADAIALKEPDALPDEYLRLTETYLAANASNTRQALAALNQGLHHLGSLPVLEQRALHIELQQSQPEAALVRVNRLLAQQQSNPNLLFQKGKILTILGDNNEAMQTYSAAKNAIENLPATRRDSQAMLALRSELNEQVALITQQN